MREGKWKCNRILEAVPSLRCPLTEISGNHRVLIENHNGIIAYSSVSICICTAIGTIRIEGDNLEIKCISKDRVIIAGNICSVGLSQGRNANEE